MARGDTYELTTGIAKKVGGAYGLGGLPKRCSARTKAGARAPGEAADMKTYVVSLALGCWRVIYALFRCARRRRR